jgi:hypothetical protein
MDIQEVCQLGVLCRNGMILFIIMGYPEFSCPEQNHVIASISD